MRHAVDSFAVALLRALESDFEGGAVAWISAGRASAGGGARRPSSVAYAPHSSWDAPPTRFSGRLAPRRRVHARACGTHCHLGRGTFPGAVRRRGAGSDSCRRGCFPGRGPHARWSSRRKDGRNSLPLYDSGTRAWSDAVPLMEAVPVVTKRRWDARHNSAL